MKMDWATLVQCAPSSCTNEEVWLSAWASSQLQCTTLEIKVNATD